MPNPREEAIKTILARKNVVQGGQGTMGPIHMGNTGLPPITPARGGMEMAGDTMRGWGENFPAFFNKPKEGGYQAGLQVPMGQGSLGGSLSAGGGENKFELMAKNLGISAQELRIFLAMRGTEPSRFGGSYTGGPLSLSYEQSLPKGQQAVSAGGSFALPGGAGTVGAQGTYDIEDPQRSSLMGTFSKRW
jgi:hypothetical protein